MPTKRTISSHQLRLIIGDGPHDEGWWTCQGIFTRPYLRQQQVNNELCPHPDEVASLYEIIRSRWIDNFPGLRIQNEAYTRTRFLDPTIRDLGWYFIPEKSLPEGKTRKKPDYCFFGDEETEQSAVTGDATAIFRASLTALEAKKAQHPLDEVSKSETPGWFPSQQIQDYLRWATDNTGQRFFRWGILTNGNEWRLYCWDAAPDSYFAFHLASGEEFCPLEEFRLFVALFRPDSYYRNEHNRCLLDAIREQSLTQQVELETNLRKRIFDVLEELSEGFYNNPENQLIENDLPAVYETSLIFLYRLLFVLYAESRGLLPAKPRGAGSNRRYREEFSLARFVEKLRNRSSFPDDVFDGLYKEVLKLFHLINGTNKTQNERLGVTRYNGGLFNSHNYPTIERWWVGEKTLANVLRQLVFAQPPARGRARQQVIVTDETIDYSTLEVRQLGDIYEGLLGGRLQLAEDGHLELLNERGSNQRQGIFYTPDWVVIFLIRETLNPLLEEIERNETVQRALKAKSMERRQDNSFAIAVLRLNVVDPAMGSGHFLVRAVEFLARRIVGHITTKTMTEKVVSTGLARRTREQILADGRIPISPGVPQEQAEIAYWRRRVVEACIYGVDSNPLAVELAKLSLWLTCIAVDEPLNFLDHHLRCGNSLLWANADELHRLPFHSEEQAKQAPFNIGDQLGQTLSHVINENVNIESEASTDMEIVKNKENRWKEVRSKLQPFINTANLWLAALGGLAINDLDYRTLVLSAINPDELSTEQKREAKRLRHALENDLGHRAEDLQPFHWELEFPDVFYGPDGQRLTDEEKGFDAILGNPPYISAHTSSEEKWRSAVERRFGYLEDLYIHFSDLGFRLLRPSGILGFIASDTFFTLTGKLRLRELFQSNRLTILGQCDPFEATVDAAIFTAQRGKIDDGEQLLFIQARYGSKDSQPEKELPKLPHLSQLNFTGETVDMAVRHGFQGCLRYHETPIRVYREAFRHVFFEPRPTVLELYKRFNDPLKALTDEWWDRIENSLKFSENLDLIRAYHSTLKPGDITMIGLIADGAQGMRTGNNARFLGYLEGTPQARDIEIKRDRWTRAWMSNPRINTEFLGLLEQAGGDPRKPTASVVAWEACIEHLKAKFDARRELGFNKTDLYRIVPRKLVATEDDFIFTWRRRKAELLDKWQSEPELRNFWESKDLFLENRKRAGKLRWHVQDMCDEDICRLCKELVAWREQENERRRAARPRGHTIPRETLGLRPSENYSDPADAPRISVIFNGLNGRGQWVAFRKSDPEGNRWVDNEPLFIDWSSNSVEWLSTASEARWQGHQFFFKDGITWTALANHAAMKARHQKPCVFDASSMYLTPLPEVVDPLVFLALLNSDIISFFKMKFLRHTQTWEIGDLRALPLVIPTEAQSACLRQLAEHAISIKQFTFRGQLPGQDLIAYIRELNEKVSAEAPVYLRPSAQLRLVRTADDCLDTIQSAVNWEAEKLYGIEGLGPFDEF